MAMLLRGDEGNEFELALIADRFPEVQDGMDDSGYLTLSFRVATPDEAWEETAPCLNVFEVGTLAEWLDAVGRAEPEISEVELLEPELRFSVVADGGQNVTVRIAFHLEDRPGIFEVDAPTDEADWIDIRISRELVRAAAADLREDYEAALRTHRVSKLRDTDEDPGMQGVPDENLNLIADESVSPEDLTDEDRRR